MDLHLRPVTPESWRDVADLAPRDDQRRFVPALAARYLLLGLLEDTWHNVAVYEGDTAVAHLMWAVDDEDGSRWIGGLVVDQAHQGRGIGRRAVELLVAELRRERGPIRISYHPENLASRALFTGLGFVDTGEWEDDERVLELLS